ncbi:hypothetical protein JCM1840_003835 [Sporobolomyces johnsonii]
MPPASINQLKLLRRTDLQRLAKENGIAANGKSVIIISSLAQLYGFDATPAAPTGKVLTSCTKPKRSSAATRTAKAIKATKTPVPVVDAVTNEMSLMPTPAMNEAVIANNVSKGQGVATSSSSSPLSSSNELVAQEVSAERIVYATSPETQAIIDTLLTTVNALRSELTAAQSTISDLSATVSTLSAAQASRAPSLTKADILALVKQQLAELQPTLHGPSTPPTELGTGTEGVTAPTNSTAKAVGHLDAQAEAAAPGKEGTENAIGHRCATFSSGLVVADASLRAHASSAARRIPTILITTSDSTAEPAHASSAARRMPTASTSDSTSTAEPAYASSATRRKIRRIPTTSTTTSTSTAQPAHASSAARRTPTASTSTSTSTAEPASPSPAKPVTGKHKRSSFAMSLRLVPDDDGHSKKKQKVSWRDEQLADDNEQVDNYLSQTKTGVQLPEIVQPAIPSYSSLAAWEAAMAKLPKGLPIPCLPFPLVARPAPTASSSTGGGNFINFPRPSTFTSAPRQAMTASSNILAPANPSTSGGIFANSLRPSTSTSKTKAAIPPDGTKDALPHGARFIDLSRPPHPSNLPRPLLVLSSTRQHPFPPSSAAE